MDNVHSISVKYAQKKAKKEKNNRSSTVRPSYTNTEPMDMDDLDNPEPLDQAPDVNPVYICFSFKVICSH